MQRRGGWLGANDKVRPSSSMYQHGNYKSTVEANIYGFINAISGNTAM